MARFLFWCINGNGLGHVTRTLAIARQIRRIAPDVEILVLTSSEHAGVLSREGIASVKVPSAESFEQDQRLPVPQLVHALTSQTVAIFRPDLVVVDANPAGLYGELLSPVATITKRVFVFGMFPNWVGRPEYKFAVQMYGRIVVPYHEVEKEEINIETGDKGVWTGEILVRSRDEILSRDIVRKRLGIMENELVFYAALGGGGHPQNNEGLAWLLDVLSEFSEIRVACPLSPLSNGHDALLERERVIPISRYPMMDYFAGLGVES